MKPARGDFAAWNRLADEHLRLLGATGDRAHLTSATEAVTRSLTLACVERNRGALALRIGIELAQHRFEEARHSAHRLRELLPESWYPRLCLGDALFNLGEYAAADGAWNEALAMEGSSLAIEPRLAQLDVVHGRLERARERLAQALELARASASPLPDAVVSCHLRLGELAFKTGNWETAQAQYEAALSFQPEDYGSIERLAELRGAQGRIGEAATLYTRLIERTGRPELMQALGDLHAFAGRADDARRWHDRAEAAYHESIGRGEVSCFHHLAGFYADSREEPEKAVEWARRDLALRRGIHAYDALAWALYRAGKLDEARDAIARALTTGTRDAHILHHAGLIRMSAGDVPGGRAALKAAFAANPRHHAFHVHR